jgi:DNA-binding NarL/FixJ family response regulator
MIKILIADDQSLIRKGLRALLETEEEFAIVGEAENGQEAIDLVAQFQPDVVLMDIQMPVVDGVASTQEICQRFPTVRVLVLTTFANHEYVSRALQVGASGYLLKNTPYEELNQAIRSVCKGYTQIGPGLWQAALQSAAPVLPMAEENAALMPAELSDLTPRELEIVHWLTKGSSNREIAQALYISEKTVKNNVSNILNRLGLRDRTQLVILALQAPDRPQL